VIVLRIAQVLVCCFIGTFEFMLGFLSFRDRPIRARSFYPKQRCSNFRGLQKAKVGIGRYLRSIFVFKSEDGPVLLKVTGGRTWLIPLGSRNVVTMLEKPRDF